MKSDVSRAVRWPEDGHCRRCGQGRVGRQFPGDGGDRAADGFRGVHLVAQRQHPEAGISLCDAVNFLVEKYALVRTDQPGFSACTRSQLINSIDILRARRATGLMTRDNYRTVNNIILGKHPEVKQ